MARVHVDLALRWGDQDAYGHINNVAYARYLEEARVRMFGLGATRERTGLEKHFGGGGPDGLKMLVANQTIEFVSVLDYSDAPVTVEVWVGRIGGPSLELHYELLDGSSEARRVVARAITTVVTTDGRTLKPMRLSPEARASMTPWTDTPLQLRRG